MAASFKVTSRDENDCRIIAISGEVDMDSSPQLRDEIQRALKAAKCLKLDLKDVKYLDSSGIAILIQGLKLAQKEEVDYRLLDPSTQVRAVIELAQLQQLFTVETSGGSE